MWKRGQLPAHRDGLPVFLPELNLSSWEKWFHYLKVLIEYQSDLWGLSFCQGDITLDQISRRQWNRAMQLVHGFSSTTSRLVCLDFLCKHLSLPNLGPTVPSHTVNITRGPRPIPACEEDHLSPTHTFLCREPCGCKVGFMYQGPQSKWQRPHAPNL